MPISDRGRTDGSVRAVACGRYGTMLTSAVVAAQDKDTSTARPIFAARASTAPRPERYSFPRARALAAPLNQQEAAHDADHLPRGSHRESAASAGGFRRT